MLFKKFKGKLDKRVGIMCTGIGSLCLAIGIILEIFMKNLDWVDFIIGLLDGISIVFNIGGIAIVGKNL